MSKPSKLFSIDAKAFNQFLDEVSTQIIKIQSVATAQLVSNTIHGCFMKHSSDVVYARTVMSDDDECEPVQAPARKRKHVETTQVSVDDAVSTASKKRVSKPDNFTAYRCFYNMYKNDVKAKEPTLNAIAIQARVSEKWTTMTAEEIAPFKALAEKQNADIREKIAAGCYEKAKRKRTAFVPGPSSKCVNAILAGVSPLIADVVADEVQAPSTNQPAPEVDRDDSDVSSDESDDDEGGLFVAPTQPLDTQPADTQPVDTQPAGTQSRYVYTTDSSSLFENNLLDEDEDEQDDEVPSLEHAPARAPTTTPVLRPRTPTPRSVEAAPVDTPAKTRVMSSKLKSLIRR